LGEVKAGAQDRTTGPIACTPLDFGAFSTNDWTAFVIFIAVIGGVGRIEGPIVGTAIFFLLRQLFSDLGSLYLLMLGAVPIAVMLFAPRGAWGLVADRFGLQIFPLQRRLALADDPTKPGRPE
jgi:branched-chain amino acid transport system permease protein